MSTPPRESYSGNGSRYNDRNKRSRRDSYDQNHHSSRSHHNNRHYNSNSSSDRTHQPYMNMYIQRRDYYHPTFNQYGAASNNYVRDTNIHVPHPPNHNRGRGYGDEYQIPRRNDNYYNNDDYNTHNHYRNQSTESHSRFHPDNPKRDNERQDKYSPFPKPASQPASDDSDGGSGRQSKPISSDQQQTSSQVNNNDEVTEVTLSTEQTSVSVASAVASAPANNYLDIPKKKREKEQ